MQVRLGLAAPAAPQRSVVEPLCALLGAPLVVVDRPGWWSGHITADCSPDVAVRARRRAVGAGVDAAVTHGELLTSGAGLVVSDVDSTLITDEVIELLADHAGTRERVAELTETAMRGEMDFATSLAVRVETLAGVPEGALREVAESVVLSPGAAELVCAVQRAGGAFGVVSGGFAEIVEPVVAPLGITLVRANRLEVVDGVLTGRTTGPIVDAGAKRTTMMAWAHDLGVGLARTVAVGDGANDVEMLDCAAVGIAYCAKPIVAQSADAAIRFPRLDAVAGLVGLW